LNVDKKPLMIMVAPNGARLLKDKNPATPVTPAEIAADVLACARAGASMAHIHARAPDGQPSDDVDVYREIVERIREHSDIVMQLSLCTIGFSPPSPAPRG
jgi:3-keto-5-aminohexanoate cleavage enzyme